MRRDKVFLYFFFKNLFNKVYKEIMWSWGWGRVKGCGDRFINIIFFFNIVVNKFYFFL